MKRVFILNRVVIVLCALVACTTTVSAQSSKAKKPVTSGVIVDQYNNAIAGAIVEVAGKDIATLTNPDGSFSLQGNFSPNAEIKVSAVGYRNIDIERGVGAIKIEMKDDAANQDQLINVIHDKRAASTLGSSVVTVTGEELRRTKRLDLGAALAGRLPGLIVRSSGNTPGEEYSNMNIRGTSTINGRTPLILLDGMVITDINAINPMDVEMITVLKDAAATGLYGMQAANGIINIETRRGKSGDPTVNVDYNFTTQQQIVNPLWVSSEQYAKLANEAYKNDGYGDYFKYSKAQIDGFAAGEDNELYPDNNWWDLNMAKSVQTHNVHLSASGGGEFVKYYVGAGYIHQGSPFNTEDDITEKYGLNRFDIRSNVDVKLNDWISAFANVSVRTDRTMTTATPSSTIVGSIYGYEPTINGPLTPDGNIVVDVNNISPAYGQINRDGYRRQTMSDMTSITGVNFDLDFITEGLSTAAQFKFYSVGLSTINGTRDYERHVVTTADDGSLAYKVFGTNANSSISLTKGVVTNFRSEIDWNLDYKRTFGDHSVRANTFMNKQFYNAFGTSFPYARMTFGGQLSYGYKNVLFVDAIASYQGSEQFEKSRRYGLFPSLSAAWVLSNQDFLADNDVVTYLKLKASYGMIGNDQLGADRFIYSDKFYNLGAGTAYYDNLKGSINEAQYGNPFLTWEKSHYTNVGVDVALWNQLTVGLEYFYDKRTDILIDNTVTPSMGGIGAGKLPKTNNGTITNNGFDLQLGYHKKFNKDWSLDVNSHFSYNSSYVESINELQLADDYYQRYKTTGFTVGQLRGYKVDYSNGNGFFNSQEEIDNANLTYASGTPRPGDLIFQDLNKDNIIDERDITNIGESTIPKISWGAEVTANWKGVYASVLVQGIGKVSKTFSGCGYYDTYSDGAYFTNQLTAWTPERYANGEKITAPALSVQKSTNECSNDYFLENKAFVRVRNIELGYTLPEKASRFLTSKKVNVYAAVANPFTFDKMKNPDIDVEMNEMTTFGTARYVSVGFDIIF